jgi:hypothetical protein
MNWKTTVNTVACVAGLMCVGVLFADEFPAWAHHGEFAINTSATGANIPTPLFGFPLLVRLTPAVFDFSQARGHGEDIRFSTASGRAEPFQIERWDSAAGVAEIWVKIDTVTGNSTAQKIKMHWGRDSVASASNGPAVFNAASGFVGVWHLGGAGTRANSAAGGIAAVPNNYPASASQPGVIGLADSLGGGSPGSYLDIGDGYDMFESGLTFSAWVNPDSSVKRTHILDLGNGGPSDNIYLEADTSGHTATFANFNGSDGSGVHAPEALVPNQWQFIAVTMSGTLGKVYRNGTLIAYGNFNSPDYGQWRQYNYLGKSNFASHNYFRGRIDEPVLSNVVHSANWIKMSYENEKPDQQVVTFQTKPPCVDKFSVPKDTAVAEGSFLELAASVECSDGFYWNDSGSVAPRILDPEVQSLRVPVPRVNGDTSMSFTFSARFGDTLKSGTVVVHIKETIPDPAFSLPASLDWSGRDTLFLKPEIANLAAIIASASPLIRFTWSMTDAEADTTIMSDALMLKSTAQAGKLKIQLCLDNGGANDCRATLVTVNEEDVVGLRALKAGRRSPSSRRPRLDPLGRFMLTNDSKAGRGSVPLFEIGGAKTR